MQLHMRDSTTSFGRLCSGSSACAACPLADEDEGETLTTRGTKKSGQPRPTVARRRTPRCLPRRLLSAAMNTADETPDSFTSAWSKANFPPENRDFVERFTAEISISRYEFVGASYRYISATRRDGTGELRIHSGCTTGFTEDEARHFGVGSDEVRPATTQGVTWLVGHPVHGDLSLRGPNGSMNKPEPERCSQCRIYELSLSGVCPGCDDD